MVKVEYCTCINVNTGKVVPLGVAVHDMYLQLGMPAEMSDTGYIERHELTEEEKERLKQEGLY